MKSLVATSLLGCACALPLTAGADTADNAAATWEAVVSPFALHWSSDEEHRHVVLLGLERSTSDGWLAGASVFRNSFGQPSAYGYYGYKWNGLFDNPAVFLKLSGGVLYGYKGRYKNKVPFNHNGFGLAAIPAVGYQLSTQDAVQIGILGTAAIIFTYNRRF